MSSFLPIGFQIIFKNKTHFSTMSTRFLLRDINTCSALNLFEGSFKMIVKAFVLKILIGWKTLKTRFET